MIFDRWGNPLGDLPYAIKAIRTRATDGTDTLDITTIGEINKDERIVFKDSTGRWAEYLCQSTQTARAAGMPVTVAYCTGSIAELSRTYIEDKRNRNANAKACLAKALEGTRWTVGTVETGTRTRIADLAFYHCTVLEAVQKTADTYGLEAQTEYQPDPTGNRIGQRIIHLVEHRGQTTSTKRFEYGKDLTQIKRDIDAGDVITRLYGWGKGIEQTNEEGEPTGGYGRKISFADVNNGKPYIQDDQALANWGIVGADGTKHHSEASVDFPDCEDPKELLNLTKAALKTRTTPVVSYTADVTALGQAGYDPEGTDVGDSVQIIDTSFATPLRLEGRILQIEEDLAGSLAETKITLGNIRQSYTQRMAAQQQALDKLVSNSGAWNSAAGGTGPYMKDLIDRINQIMNATGGYTYLKPGQGIYVYDKPEDQNPTQCIHIGGGYWRIADHKKPNGDWDFRALANGKGIFADTVFTGRLSDAAGLNYWDMDTGDFSLSARSTIGGKTVQQYADGAVSDANSYTDAAKQAAITEAKRQADAALSGAKTYAEAIMAYGSNLVRNPNGNPDHDLDKLGASKLTKTMPATHPEGITSAIHLGNVRDTYFGWPLDTFRGHTFRLSGWAYRKAGNVTSSFGIHWTDTGNGNHWQTIAQSAADANGWTYVSGSYTVPSNAKTARLWMQVDRNPATASDADWYWTGLQCTDETAANYNDLAANLIGMGVGVLRRHNVRLVIAGQIGRNRRPGTKCRDNGIRLHTADELRRSLGAEHHGNVVILHDLSGLRVDIQLELALKRDILLNEEHTAESVGFLDHSDLMAALGSDQRRLHSSDTAADNHDIPLMHGRRIIFALKLAPCGGIDRAAILSGGNKLAETGVAAQALVDLVLLTHSRFVWQVGIGNNTSADFDDVY